MYKIRTLIIQVKNFFSWGWTLRNNFDHDFEYIYKILYLKLDRMVEIFPQGWSLRWTFPNCNQFKKLKEARFIAKRLSSMYEDPQYRGNIDAHYKKYPLRQYNNESPNFIRYMGKEEKRSFRNAYKMDNKKRIDEVDRLFYILSRYESQFSD